MKIPDIKGRKPLVLHGTEPPFNLGLLRWGIRLVIMDNRTDSGSKKFHLFIFKGTAIVKVKHARSAIFGNSRFHDRHKVYEVVIIENINTNDETAGIIDESNDRDFMLFAIGSFQVWSYMLFSTLNDVPFFTLNGAVSA